MRRCFLVLGVLSSVAASPAQEPAQEPAGAPATATSPGPAAPIVRIELAGPAAFRAAFLPTNVGSMLASEEGERLWRPLTGQVDGYLKTQLGDGFAACRRRLLDFGGRASFVWFAGPGGDEAFSGALVLDGAPAEALDALAADLDALLGKLAPGEDVEIGIGDQEFAARREGSDSYTRPRRLGARVVAMLATDTELADAGKQLLAFLEQPQPAAPPAPLRVRIDLGQLVDRFGPSGADAAAWRDTFGLGSLGELTLTLAPRGPRCELEFALAFRRAERGVFAGLLPAAAGMPALLARLPKGITPWKCGPLSLRGVFATVIATVAAEQGRGGEAGLEQTRKELRDELGFDLESEFLAHLGDEVLVLGDFWDEGDLERIARGDEAKMGFCLVFPVRDDAAFGTGLDKLLVVKNFLQVRHREERDGMKVRTVGNMFLPSFLVASGKGIGAVAFGDEGARLLEAVTAPGQPGDRAAALLEAYRRAEPPGVNGVAVADLRALCGGQLPVVLELIGESLPASTRDVVPLEVLPELLQQLAPLLEKHQLDRVVSFSGFAAQTYRWRLLW